MQKQYPQKPRWHGIIQTKFFHNSKSWIAQPEKQDVKLHLMMLREDFKKDINNSLKEIQENMGKQVKALKEETQRSLKEIQEIMGQEAEALKEETQKSLKELQENTNK